MYIIIIAICFLLLTVVAVAVEAFEATHKEGSKDETSNKSVEEVVEKRITDENSEIASSVAEKGAELISIGAKTFESTVLSRLYALRQEIALFETEFPSEYAAFLRRIETIEEACYTNLQELEKTLTFAIDPDIDMEKVGETTILEKDIQKFLETKVKSRFLSNRLGRLITKLNILYNVSILHNKTEEKQKVISQLSHAIETEKEIVQEIKQSEYIMADKKLRQKLLELITYAEYLILKAGVKNSNQTPGELIEKSVLLSEFEGFEYAQSFKSFIKDEVYDLGELHIHIADEECRRVLKEECGKILIELTYAENVEEKLWDSAFWKSFLEYESELLEILKANGMSKDEAKVPLIARMNIKVEEHEVLVSPVANAYLALSSVFSKTQDERVLLLLKLLKQMSKEVTYKEIYFLILLFDANEAVQSVPNSLISVLSKYQAKYPYDPEEIRKKKQLVKAKTHKEYVPAFEVDSHAKKLTSILEKLDIDFSVAGDKVLINSFYFSGLSNVLSSFNINNNMEDNNNG